MREILFKVMRVCLSFGLILALWSAMVLDGAHPVLAQSKTPIKIGFSIALTGGLAVNGKTALLARQIWRDDINARGGILGRPVEFVFYDDQSSAAVSPGIYAKLIDVDKVDIIYAPYGSVPQAPILPMAKQRELLIFGNFSTWANEELKYERYFQCQPAGPPSDEFPAGFARIAARKGFKTIAMIASDTEGTLYWLDSNRRVAKSSGMTVVYDQKFPLNTVEFSTMLRAINATKPDAVYVATYANETIGMMNALNEIGLNESVKMFGGGMMGLQTAPFLERLGPALNGVITINFYVKSKTLEFPGLKGYFDAYQARAKQANVEELGYYMSTYNYAMGEIMEQAIKATKTLDNKVLAKYMHEQEFNTIMGKISFGPTGEWRKARVLQAQFQGVKGSGLDQYRREGTQVILDPPEFANGELKWPFAAARK